MILHLFDYMNQFNFLQRSIPLAYQILLILLLKEKLVSLQDGVPKMKDIQLVLYPTIYLKHQERFHESDWSAQIAIWLDIASNWKPISSNYFKRYLRGDKIL